MRVFRSNDIKGPYKDVADKDARAVINPDAGNTTGTTGMRIMSYYKWSFADYGYTAQEHNSATVDEDGKAYVIYHNKYNDGTAAHEARVHQLLTNKDGWILAAPFEYAGETVNRSGYSQSAFTGDYGIMFQKQNIDHAKLQCAEEQKITLEEGTLTGGTYTGNITGDYTGTWTSEERSPYVSLQIGNTTYKGIFCEGTIDETSVQTMTFTAVGDNQECLWGYKVKDPTVAIRMTIDKVIKLPEEAATDITLPSTGAGGSTITWKSNSVAINDNGTISHLFNEDTKVSMTATITNGGVQFDKVYEFTVVGNERLSKDGDVVLGKFYENEELDMSALSQKNTPSFANPFHYTDKDISNGISISFDVTRTAISDRLSNIISFNNKLGKLYFTGGSYLGYNDFNGHFIDVNLNANFAPGDDYLADNTKVTIKIEIDSNGFTVYKDGTKVYTSSEVIAGTVPGGFSKDANGKNPEKTILAWIKNAPELNFGSGNFWNDLIFKGKIGNVVCAYKQPLINIDGGSSSLSGLYTQDYENVSNISTEWISTNAQDKISLGSGDEGHGKYMLYDFTGDIETNSRGAHSYFGDSITWPDNYILEFDMALKAGNNQESQIAVITSNASYPSKVENNGIETGYIFKMASTNSETWTINGDATKIVNIPKSSWIHFTLTGTKGSSTAHLKITNGSETLFDGNVTATDTGEIKGLYILAGRYQAVFKTDNIVVKEPGVDYTNLTAYNNILKQANQHISAQEANQIYTVESYQALTDAVATAQDTVTNTSAQDIVDAQTATIKTAINGLERRICTITVEDAANGTVTGLAADGKYMAGDYIMLKAVPDTGYSFGGWKAGNEDIGKYTTYSAMVRDDTIITPVFKSGTPATPAPLPVPTPTPTATPGGSTTQGGTTEPGGSTTPGGTATPGGTTEPGGSTTQGGTTEPGGTTAPGGTATPGGTTEPGGSTTPRGTTTPGGTTAPGSSAEPSQKPSGGGSGIGSYIPTLPVTPEQPGTNTNTGTGASAAPGTQATPGTGTATKAPEPSKAPETQATPEASTAPGTQATKQPGVTSETKVDEETGAVTETTTKVEDNKTTVTEKVTMPDGAESIKETVTEDKSGLTVVTETTTTNNTASVLVTTVTSDANGNVVDANAVIYTGPSDTGSKYSAKTIIPESYLKEIKDAGMDSIDIYVEMVTTAIPLALDGGLR